MTKTEAKRHIWKALYSTLESDLRGNGAAYIYGSDDEFLPKEQIQQRVNAAEAVLDKLYRLSHNRRRT